MSDLPPEEWQEAFRAAAAGGAQVDENTLLVRSHVYAFPNGAQWIVLVPAFGLDAVGTAADVAAAYKAIDAQLGEWFPPTADDKTMTIVRVVRERE